MAEAPRFLRRKMGNVATIKHLLEKMLLDAYGHERPETVQKGVYQCKHCGRTCADTACTSIVFPIVVSTPDNF